MATAVLDHTGVASGSLRMTLEEYLATAFRPDREFIDGEVIEKNMGKNAHSRMQALLASYFINNEDLWGMMGYTEWRTLVTSSRVRLPDVMLVRAGKYPDVLDTPPVLVVEILSPDDTYADTQRRAQDYLRMGAGAVWLIDPEARTARQCVGDTWTGTLQLTVPGTEIAVDMEPLFAKLG